MQLEWRPDGRATTDNRYAIGSMTSREQTIYYLAVCPLLVVERDDAGQIVNVVKDEVPRGSESVAEIRLQAQAIEDGTLDEFEYARSQVMREQMAVRSGGRVDAEALVAWHRRTEADADLSESELRARREAVVAAAEDWAALAREMFAATYGGDA